MNLYLVLLKCSCSCKQNHETIEKIEQDTVLESIIQIALSNKAYGFYAFNAESPEGKRENVSSKTFLVSNELDVFSKDTLSSNIHDEKDIMIAKEVLDTFNVDTIVKTYNRCWVPFIPGDELQVCRPVATAV
ncbi:MAG: hypothetical protein N4A44_00135 [Alphaproteobacteria bacterium]|jgi:hypothetical protein|nr:hypothetical protein [Alphaproteobacteria bacterium]